MLADWSYSFGSQLAMICRQETVQVRIIQAMVPQVGCRWAAERLVHRLVDVRVQKLAFFFG